MFRPIIFVVLLALLPITLFAGGSGNGREHSRNAIKVGEAQVNVKLRLFSESVLNPMVNGEPLEQFLNKLSCMIIVNPLLNREDNSRRYELTFNHDNFIYSGKVPLDRKEEIATCALFYDGMHFGGVMTLLRQDAPVDMEIQLRHDGSPLNVIFGEGNLSLKDWLNFSMITQKAMDLNFVMSMKQNPKKLTGDWQEDMKFVTDSLWPQYKTECLQEGEMSEAGQPMLINNLKMLFAAQLVTRYVDDLQRNNVKLASPPPLEAYAFLDSIDYSPDILLLNSMLFSQRDFWSEILCFTAKDYEAIGETPVKKWKEAVSRHLSPAIKNPSSLLLDMLAALAYTIQLENRKALTPTQIKNIRKGFRNGIGPLLLAKNEDLKAELERGGKPLNLENELFFLEDYLNANYAGRPVVVDMWNTWCSPCLEAIAQSAELKHSAAAADAVFLYVADTSSPLGAWNSKALSIGGDHVRISLDAAGLILKDHNLTGFPSYLFFDRNHRLVHAQTSFPDLARFEQLLRQIAE